MPSDSWDAASLHSLCLLQIHSLCKYLNPLCLPGRIKYWCCAISFSDVIRPSLSDINTHNCTVYAQRICSLCHSQRIYVLGRLTNTPTCVVLKYCTYCASFHSAVFTRLHRLTQPLSCSHYCVVWSRANICPGLLTSLEHSWGLNLAVCVPLCSPLSDFEGA